MKRISTRGAALACGIAAAVLLAGCGTRHVSRGIDAQGQAAEVVFPEAARAVLREGTFPSREALRTIGPGATKDQLYQSLGRPHFREALYGVRAWDYLFHFRTPAGVVTCQYKVIFDEHARAQSFHWSPASCVDQLAEASVPAAAPAPRPAASGETRIELSADALFAFAGAGPGDILADGRARLLEIAQRLSAARDLRVRVVGHTDRIGGDAANQALSLRRAETVRQVLVDGGVPASAIVAEGAGEARPVTTGCGDALPRRALVQWLAPDRRVELFVHGIGVQ